MWILNFLCNVTKKVVFYFLAYCTLTLYLPHHLWIAKFLKVTKPIISSELIIEFYGKYQLILSKVMVIGKRKKAAFKWCMND